ADLAVLSLSAYPYPDGGTLVQAVVRNQGDAPTQSGFFTDLYADHLPTGSGDYQGSIHFWVASPIEAGRTVTLTTVVVSTTAPGTSTTRVQSTLGEATSTLYVQVDSAGAVGESSEENNISTGVEVCTTSADSYEEDDTPEAASTLSLGQVQTHNIDRPGDLDWVKFTAEAGKSYVLRTSNIGSSGDTYLYLYDTDATTLMASNDDFGGSLASRIEWLAPATGTYYLLVKHWNPNAGGCGTAYDLSVTQQALLEHKVMLPLVMR
ncbi:MAG: pre-peptidase C-terminal domain-containing protein, partial [Anaerolineae bacterium]|nr:pre-peptidase C-terminal domain-containing protein [Anaerolineae bacterium]